MPACRFLCSIAVFFCLSIPSVFAEKPVLVLFPVQVGSADADYEGEFGSALQEGLQSRYKVFYGPAVEDELEKEYQKIDCDAERCQQNVAIAFNGELVADASAKRIGNGYALKLVVSNVITGEIVDSQTYPCRNCDPFAVIDAFKVIGLGKSSSSSTGLVSSGAQIKMLDNSSIGDSNTVKLTGEPSIFIFDSKPSGAEVSINGKVVGTTPYQGLNHHLGESLQVTLNKTFYKSHSFTAILEQPLLRLKAPVILEQGKGQLLVSIDPYEHGVELWVADKNYGQVPQRITLPAGQHSLQIKKNGKTITQQSVSVEDASVNQALLSRIATGKLVITRALTGKQASRSIFILDSNPSGAQISINGRAAGITPYQGLEHQRNKTVKVTLSKPYYQPTSFETTLDNELVYLSEPIQLKRGQGKVIVVFEPFTADMQLQIDGEDKGELPQQLNLLAGEHTVKAFLKGSEVANKVIEIKHGSNQQVVLNSQQSIQVDVGHASLEMQPIPGGSFIMGSNNGDKDERPVHTVTIKPFKMSKTETTFAQWDACVSAGGCSYKPEGNKRGDHPVVSVNYLDITSEFIPWINSVTGKIFRLPSEAEWEYAARAGSTTRYSWGNDINCDQANYGSYKGVCGNANSSLPVGSFKPNAFGLFDMHGNVKELTEDCWNDDYSGYFSKAPTDGSAWLSGDCNSRVLRDGVSGSQAEALRSANRNKFTYLEVKGDKRSSSRNSGHGFRLVQE